MSETFRTTVTWTGDPSKFEYKSYDRTHLVKYGSGATITGSAAPAFLGKPDLVNPEESLVGAASACHLLTFLALAARKGHVVLSYEDQAEGFLEKNEKGKLHVSRITLRPKVAFAEGKAPDQNALGELHTRAHEECFIANSILSKVTVVVS